MQHMSTSTKKTSRSKTQRAVRATASLPPDIYQTLQDIAKHKKVSVAWVIRDAAEKYIGDQWPLLGRNPS